jgi:hypothetical protein
LSVVNWGALENEGMGIVEFKAGAELNEGAFINSCAFCIKLVLLFSTCVV